MQNNHKNNANENERKTTMKYNPPGNDVHMMAKELSKIFDRKWNDFGRKWKFEDEHDKSETETIKETGRKSLDAMLPRHKDSLPKKTQLFEHKGMHKIRSLATKDARVSVVCEGEKSYCNIKGYNMFTAIDEIKLVSAAFLLVSKSPALS